MSRLPRSASAYRKQDAAAATVLVIATLLVFWPVANHPFVPYDDGISVFGNPNDGS
jgi:hypothetical protein